MTVEGLALAFAVFAGSIALVRLIRRRQQQLTELLRDYVKEQLEWSRKKNRAALIAQLAAQRKSKEEADLVLAAQAGQASSTAESHAFAQPQAERS